MNRIETDAAPAPGGHYAQGISHGGLVFVSGQLPVDPATGAKETGSIEAQTRRVLANVLAIVEAGGSEKALILKTTVYIADMALWDRVNAVYAEFFGLYRPARAVVPTRELHHGFAIEVEAVAATKA